MNGKIVLLNKPRRPSTEPETIQARIASDLVNDKPVITAERSHSFEDVLQHLWGNVDDTEVVDNALQSIAMGGHESAVQILKSTLLRSAEEYALGIAADVVKFEMAEANHRAAEDYQFAENYHL